MAASTRSLWLIDGYNVLRVSLQNGREGHDTRSWWTEERRRTLLELAARLPEPQAEVWVVFDGQHLTEPRVKGISHKQDELLPRRAGPESVGCVFAPSADVWILQALKARRARRNAQAAKPGCTLRALVVTADRPLASRSRQLGAEIITTGSFVERCRGNLRGSVT